MATRKPKHLPTRIELEAGEYPQHELLPMLTEANCEVSDTAAKIIESEPFSTHMGFGNYELVLVKGYQIERHMEGDETLETLYTWVKERYGLEPCPSDVAAALVIQGSSLLKDGIYVACAPLPSDGEEFIFSVGERECIQPGVGLITRPWMEMERCEFVRDLSLGSMNVLFARAR